MFTEDLSIFLDETQFAVPVVALGVSGSGIFDMPGEYVGPDGIFVSDECQIRVLRSVYGSLKYGDPVTVSGQSFEVRDARPVFDGVFVQVFLKRVAAVALARILLEDGGYMLTEDGGYVLLEA
jgi:hypothetical protein